MLQIGNDKAYSTAETAQILSMSKDAIRLLIKQDKIKSVEVGKQKYIKAADLKEYLETQKAG